MTVKESWLLPEGIDELMPDKAAQLEKMHRLLVDRMQSWGYQLVVPPLVEYLDSLLTGTAKTLDLQTFKLIDQLSGRLMGIRADMTPQVARIAAHRLRGDAEFLRLCYIGSVLHTLPEGHAGSRNPIQLGAEIYGHHGPESDIECIQLMVELLQISGLQSKLSLDIGHVGIYRGLAAQAGLDDVQEQSLFSALQRKASAEISELLQEFDLPAESQKMLAELAELNGYDSVLTTAQALLKNAPDDVLAALANLQNIADILKNRLPGMAINFDLAELRGYHYHTGVVFAVYQPDSAKAIALGGRYDDIGEDFGFAQPATGFSMDLKQLVNKLSAEADPAESITVVWSDDQAQQQKIADLRQQGYVVTYDLNGTSSQHKKQLIKQNGQWQVVETGNVSG